MFTLSGSGIGGIGGGIDDEEIEKQQHDKSIDINNNNNNLEQPSPQQEDFINNGKFCSSWFVSRNNVEFNLTYRLPKKENRENRERENVCIPCV